ncbi:MAG TPA: branched-chain amino acid ABC transporter permease [Methylomirabilota bacterium]|jgi:branched-chain amino acid transport system permease protein|nr:branched-chain amino acid ABC transporter permease [Methylomirabilota bacterium]
MTISWRRRFWTPTSGVTVAALVAVPLLLASSPYYLFLLNTIAVFVMLALGLQLVLGYGGILQLGYAGFFGLGAYTSAVLTVHHGWPFPAAFVAAMVVAVIGALVMSPIVRLHDVNFAMATFVFGLILELVYNQWSAMTNGPIGFRGIPAPTLLGLTLREPEHYYYLLLAVLLAEYLLVFRLLHSPFGTAIRAMRENETACRTAGVDVTRVKVTLLLVSSAIAGAAGSLLAHMNGFISPPTFGWATSVAVLMMVVLGGVRSLPGAIVGAVVIRLVVEQTSVLGQYSNIVFGVALVLFMAFLPTGLAGLVGRLSARVPWAGRLGTGSVPS